MAAELANRGRLASVVPRMVDVAEQLVPTLLRTGWSIPEQERGELVLGQHPTTVAWPRVRRRVRRIECYRRPDILPCRQRSSTDGLEAQGRESPPRLAAPVPVRDDP